MSDAAKLGKIFIGGLSYETTDEKLRAYFGAYGAVTDAVVMKDPISRRSRGFGFITYADPACVDRALAQPTHILDSRRVEAKRAVPRAESLRDVGSSPSSSRGNGSLASINISSAIGATKKIFVGGLHYETKDGDFKKYFMQYGKVVSAEVMFNRETNKSRGFGFVIFESEGSVEVVLQEKNHVIDGKSVEVKRAVPRTDVPPPRSVSSRAGSFSGPGGPGSVGSLDDLSCSTTPPVSLSGSVSSLNHFSSDGRTALMGNGTLVGYAAAVRYGSRGVPKGPAPIPSSVGSPTPPMMNGDALNGSMGLDASTLDGVAEALSSLVLGEPGKASSSIASPLHSATSSHGSSDKLNAVGGAASVGGLSPLDVALSPLADPVMEQWKLSPVSTARGSSSDMTSLSASETSYLSHGLLDEDANGSSSAHMAWQTSSWQQPWHSPQLRHQPPKDSSQQPSLQPQSLYAMFPSSSSQSTLSGPGSSWGSSGVGYNTPHSHDSTSPPANRFGNGLMGMDMPQMVDTSFRGPPLGNGFGMQSDVNGNGFGMQSDVNGNGFGVQRDVNGNGVGRYGPLGGGLFSPEYLPPDSRPSFGSSGGVIGSSRNVPEEDDESPRDKNDQDLAYDLPASAAEYHRQFR